MNAQSAPRIPDSIRHFRQHFEHYYVLAFPKNLCSIHVIASCWTDSGKTEPIRDDSISSPSRDVVWRCALGWEHQQTTVLVDADDSTSTFSNVYPTNKVEDIRVPPKAKHEPKIDSHHHHNTRREDEKSARATGSMKRSSFLPLDGVLDGRLDHHFVEDLTTSSPIFKNHGKIAAGRSANKNHMDRVVAASQGIDSLALFRGLGLVHVCHSLFRILLFLDSLCYRQRNT